LEENFCATTEVEVGFKTRIEAITKGLCTEADVSEKVEAPTVFGGEVVTDEWL
jgi:hypothetical protein